MPRYPRASTHMLSFERKASSFCVLRPGSGHEQRTLKNYQDQPTGVAVEGDIALALLEVAIEGRTRGEDSPFDV